MKTIFHTLIVMTIVTMAITSCTKEIDVTLDNGVSQLAVSAFVNNKPGTQQIILSTTASYFNNAPCPPATGATVKITDSKGAVFNFNDAGNTGSYSWSPNPGDTLLHPGYSYTLSIDYAGQQYQSVSVANPVPKVDSINYQFRKGNNPSGPKSYYLAFYATDTKGRSDYYWIKTFKNDTLLS